MFDNTTERMKTKIKRVLLNTDGINQLEYLFVSKWWNSVFEVKKMLNVVDGYWWVV